MRSNGFTLIELTLVLILVGILASYAIARFPDKHQFVLRSHSSLLLGHIRLSQKLAISWHQPLRFIFTSNSYCVTADLGSTDCANPITDPTTGLAFSETLDSDLSLSIASIDFDTLGRPVSAGSLKSTVSSVSLSMGVGSDTISVQPISGYAEIL